MGLSILQSFVIAKFITLFLPMQYVMPRNTIIALNIVEAIVTDLCMNRIECYCNAFFGSALIILLYKKFFYAIFRFSLRYFWSTGEWKIERYCTHKHAHLFPRTKHKTNITLEYPRTATFLKLCLLSVIA